MKQGDPFHEALGNEDWSLWAPKIHVWPLDGKSLELMSVKFLEDRWMIRHYLEISPSFCEDFKYDSKFSIGASSYS